MLPVKINLLLSPVSAELSSTKPYSECVEYLYNDLVNSFSNIKVVDSHNFVFSAKESVLTNHTNLEAAKRFTNILKINFLNNLSFFPDIKHTKNII